MSSACANTPYRNFLDSRIECYKRLSRKIATGLYSQSDIFEIKRAKSDLKRYKYKLINRIRRYEEEEEEDLFKINKLERNIIRIDRCLNNEEQEPPEETNAS